MDRTTSPNMDLVLTGDDLTLEDAEHVLRGRVEHLSLSPSARKRVEKARRCLEDLLAAGAVIYGVNTGFGKLSNQRIGTDEALALQENLLRSHAVGMGPLLGIGVSRLALALRIQALAKGHSGVSLSLVDTLIEMYNRGVVPPSRSREAWVPAATSLRSPTWLSSSWAKVMRL